MVSLRKENSLVRKGFPSVAGVDEAGRGPLAGPVVAAAVILQSNIRGLDDSKKLTHLQREKVFDLIIKKASGIGIGIVEGSVIDEINILRATFLAMKKAVLDLEKPPDMVLVDGTSVIPGLDLRQRAVIKGDGKCASIAAASVVAKVTRDGIMEELHIKYPGYGFNEHKGYGTKKHFAALKKIGACPAHRKSFAPVSLVLGKNLIAQDPYR